MPVFTPEVVDSAEQIDRIFKERCPAPFERTSVIVYGLLHGSKDTRLKLHEARPKKSRQGNRLILEVRAQLGQDSYDHITYLWVTVPKGCWLWSELRRRGINIPDGGKVYLHRLVVGLAYDVVGRVFEVHHLTLNPGDNRSCVLLMVTKKAHADYHHDFAPRGSLNITLTSPSSTIVGYLEVTRKPERRKRPQEKNTHPRSIGTLANLSHQHFQYRARREKAVEILMLLASSPGQRLSFKQLLQGLAARRKWKNSCAKNAQDILKKLVWAGYIESEAKDVYLLTHRAFNVSQESRNGMSSQPEWSTSLVG